jgi:hypothetical protein
VKMKIKCFRDWLGFEPKAVDFPLSYN